MVESAGVDVLVELVLEHDAKAATRNGVAANATRDLRM